MLVRAAARVLASSAVEQEESSVLQHCFSITRCGLAVDETDGGGCAVWASMAATAAQH
jgi:hypothetical protein